MKSVYIHIPFCKNICSYCDFCKLIYQKKWIRPYLSALEKEIEQRYCNELLETIYVGGGTPSSLDLDEMEYLFKIISKLNKNKNIEFTFECNIEDIDMEKINILKKNGVNRISIGIQSFMDKNIELLNRNHTKDEVFNKIEMLKNNGLNNINIDLIYAIPNQTLTDLEYDLNCFLELNISHISTYSLIIEENTKLFIKKIKNIDEDLDYQMYKLINKKLCHYNHYEISNFSKIGYESKHNLVYWNNDTYYGFGLGVTGYDGNNRYNNTRSLKNYLNGNYILNTETIDFNQKVENTLILGLRKLQGIDLIEFKNIYDFDIASVPFVQKLIEEKKLMIEKNYIKINDKYIYTSNDILIDFMGVNYEEV